MIYSKSFPSIYFWDPPFEVLFFCAKRTFYHLTSLVVKSYSFLNVFCVLLWIKHTFMRFAEKCILLLFTFHTASQLFWNIVHYLTKSSLRFLEGGLKRTMRESRDWRTGGIFYILELNSESVSDVWGYGNHNLERTSLYIGLCLWQHANIPPTLHQFFLQDWSAKKLEGVFVKIFLTPAPACEHVVECPACRQLLNLLLGCFKRQKIRTGNQLYTFHSLKNWPLQVITNNC